MTTIIETERLILRPLRAGDLDTLTVALNNFAVSRNTARIPFPYRRADAEDFLALTEKPVAGTLLLSITRKDGDDRVCGGISYERGESVEFGYWMAETEWGMGYGTEAAHVMAEHAFRVARHDALLAGCCPGNDASRRILEGLRFRVLEERMMFSKSWNKNIPVVRMKLRRADWKGAAPPEKTLNKGKVEPTSPLLVINSRIRIPGPRISARGFCVRGRRCVWTPRA